MIKNSGKMLLALASVALVAGCASPVKLEKPVEVEKKEPRQVTAHQTIVTLVDEMAERHDLALALQQVTADGLTRTTFRDLKRGADQLLDELTQPATSAG